MKLTYALFHFEGEWKFDGFTPHDELATEHEEMYSNMRHDTAVLQLEDPA